MKKFLLLAAMVIASIGLYGCGTSVPQAEPKFAEPPKSTLSQADVQPASQSEVALGTKPR